MAQTTATNNSKCQVATLQQARKLAVPPALLKLQVSSDTTVKALDSFVLQEPKGEEKRQMIMRDPVPERVLSALKSVLDAERLGNGSKRRAAPRVSAAQIEQFSLMLAPFQEHEMFNHYGMMSFIDELIGNSPDTNIVFHTCHLDNPISWSSLYDYKNVTIIGDLGDFSGFDNFGTVIVKGNVDDVLHYGQGGKLEIEGDVNGFIKHIKGGTVRVRGTLHGDLWNISGGTVKLGGFEGKNLTQMEGGDVFVGQVQIMRDGQVLERNYKSILRKNK